MPIIISAAHFGSGENEVDLNADNFGMSKGGLINATGNVRPVSSKTRMQL